MKSSFVSDYDYMFATFVRELEAWSESGKEPSTGDQDLRYYMDQEEKRLKKRGLSMKMRLKPYGDVVQASKIARAMGLNYLGVAQYLHSQHFQSVEKTVIYERNHRVVYRKKDDCDLYVTIIVPASKDRLSIAKMDYVCPTCGAVSKVHVLQKEGCPYCKGHFIMSDLFPKVSNFWFHNAVSIPDKVHAGLKKWIFWTSCVTIPAVFIYTFVTLRDIGLLRIIVRALVGGIFAGAIFGYLLFFGHKFVRLFKIGTQDTKVMQGKKRGNAETDSFLSQFDPAFTYEYFLAKVLSLVRTIVLADDPTNVLQYRGKALDPEFERYLTIDYGGGMDLDYADVRGERLYVSLHIFLLTTVDADHGIEERLEQLHVMMEHNTSFRVDPEFSIQRVGCTSCGSSFNALKEKRCPYCEVAHYPEEDWIVTEISRCEA